MTRITYLCDLCRSGEMEEIATARRVSQWSYEQGVLAAADTHALFLFTFGDSWNPESVHKPVESAHREFLPAAGKNWSLPLYDPLVEILGLGRLRAPLVAQAALASAHRVLDVGCGTGTFAIELKRLHPGLEVVGLDPDAAALARSRRKAERAGISIQFDQGFSDSLPYSSATFDRVFSSFMFHHVWADERAKMLEEIRRVLAVGGSFHLADFSRPEGSLPWFARHIHSSAHLRSNSDSGILALMTQAGFANPRKVDAGSTFFGLARVSYFAGQ